MNDVIQWKSALNQVLFSRTGFSILPSVKIWSLCQNIAFSSFISYYPPQNTQIEGLLVYKDSKNVIDLYKVCWSQQPSTYTHGNEFKYVVIVAQSSPMPLIFFPCTVLLDQSGHVRQLMAIWPGNSKSQMKQQWGSCKSHITKSLVKAEEQLCYCIVSRSPPSKPAQAGSSHSHFLSTAPKGL